MEGRNLFWGGKRGKFNLYIFVIKIIIQFILEKSVLSNIIYLDELNENLLKLFKRTDLIFSFAVFRRASSSTVLKYGTAVYVYETCLHCTLLFLVIDVMNAKSISVLMRNLICVSLTCRDGAVHKY